MKKVYYSPRGYWRGLSAVDKLAVAAKVPYDVAKAWLSKQAIWQIYLPRSKSIKYGLFDVYVPNEVHQADILYLPHDSGYKYVLTVVDVATQYKDAEPLMTKKSAEVIKAFKRIYKRSQLTWPNLLQVDPGNEFRGEVTSTMTKKKMLPSDVVMQKFIVIKLSLSDLIGLSLINYLVINMQKNFFSRIDLQNGLKDFQM